MIQKRYQYFSKTGIKWTNWFDTIYKDEDLNYLNRIKKYQSQFNLFNEYRLKT